MRAILGSFVFNLDSALYDEIQRSTRQRFAKKERLQQRAVYQALGPDEDRLQLPGAIYPCVAGDPASLDDLRALMATGQPQQLISLEGYLLGRWLIESVNETRSHFDGRGRAQVLEFELSLLRVDG